MKTAERLEHLENGWAETRQVIKELTQATAAIAASTAAHDDQIGKLIEVAEKQHQEWEQLRREWQAYLPTIPPRQ